MPAVTPLTLPVVFTVATAVLLLLQLPPATLSDKVVVPPVQIVVVPPIIDAMPPTVTVAVLEEVPHALLTL